MSAGIINARATDGSCLICGAINWETDCAHGPQKPETVKAPREMIERAIDKMVQAGIGRSSVRELMELIHES